MKKFVVGLTALLMTTSAYAQGAGQAGASVGAGEAGGRSGATARGQGGGTEGAGARGEMGGRAEAGGRRDAGTRNLQTIPLQPAKGEIVEQEKTEFHLVRINATGTWRSMPPERAERQACSRIRTTFPGHRTARRGT